MEHGGWQWNLLIRKAHLFSCCQQLCCWTSFSISKIPYLLSPVLKKPQTLFIKFRLKIQFSSVAQSCLTLCNPMDCSTLGLPVHHQLPELLKLMSIELVMPSNHLILCRPLLFLPSLFPSITIFSNESVLHIRGPKYWIFSFNISPSDEYSGLISFRMDWLDLLAVQGTSLLQHHSSKASILQCSAFFIVWLSHSYMTSGKIIAFTRWTFFWQNTVSAF